MNNYKAGLMAMVFTIGGCVFWGCKEGENSDSLKPKARGTVGEILLVIDSVKWQGLVGDALREVFQADVEGLIRDEQLFDIRKVDPRSMNRMLKTTTNIIYVTTFDDKNPGSQSINSLFTKEAKEKSSNDPSLYLLRSEDEFAVGQEVIYLFGRNEDELVQNLRTNKDKLQNLFEVRERSRLKNALLERKSSIANVAGQSLGLSINAPASYQIVISEDDFLWLRQPSPSTRRPDISLFFYEMDYTSEQQVLPDSIIQLRTQITKNHIYGDPANRDSYLVIETVDPTPVFNNFRINDHYAVEVRGGWKTNNLSMGGSFLAYVVLDAKKGKLYYMEGFVYYPNEAHRDAIREIETILLSTEIMQEEQEGT